MARCGPGVPEGVAGALDFPLSEVVVRSVQNAAECAKWGRLMDGGHCLGFRGMFGDDLAPLPRHRQTFHIVRNRTVIRTGMTTTEVAHGLTSAATTPPRSSPASPMPPSPSSACAGASDVFPKRSGTTSSGGARPCVRSSDPPDTHRARGTHPTQAAQTGDRQYRTVPLPPTVLQDVPGV